MAGNFAIVIPTKPDLPLDHLKRKRMVYLRFCATCLPPCSFLQQWMIVLLVALPDRVVVRLNMLSRIVFFMISLLLLSSQVCSLDVVENRISHAVRQIVIPSYTRISVKVHSLEKRVVSCWNGRHIFSHRFAPGNGQCLNQLVRQAQWR